MDQANPVVRVLVGITGLISSELYSQLRKDGALIAISRDEIVACLGHSIVKANSLIEAIELINPHPEAITVVFSFRSRSRQSLDKSFQQVNNIVISIAHLGSIAIRLVFVNSVCSSRNEATQELFYHLEKSLMKRLHVWYTDSDEVASSLNLTLHQVPRSLPRLNVFVSQIISIIMLQEVVNLNGSDINLDRHKCFTV